MFEETTCQRCHEIPEIIDPQAVLVYSRAPTPLPKLTPILQSLELSARQPTPETVLTVAPPERLLELLRRWRRRLSFVELSETRGVFFETSSPTQDDITRAAFDLVDLEALLAQLESRWLLDILRDEKLRVAFQPLVSLKTKQITGYECLLRARVNGTTIGASKLFHTAQQLDIIPLLDRLARRLAVTQGRIILEQGLRLFVNFMPSAIYDYRMCLRDTLAACRELDVPMHNLVFEMVEAEKIPDMNHLRQIIDAYRRSGANVAVDDFGSGYASLGYITELRPDLVKLDQNLVRNAHQDRFRAVLLTAVTQAARQLDIDIVAEGIETPEDLRFSMDLKVELVQGNFLAYPAEIPPARSRDAVAFMDTH